MEINKAIAAALIKDKKGLVSLLRKNGVSISSSYSDREVIIAVLEAVRSSQRFKTDLSDFLATVAVDSKMSFTGEGMFGFTGENMFRLNGVHPPNGWYGADGREPAPAAWGPQFDGSPNELQGINSGYGTTTTTTTPVAKDKLLDKDTIRNFLNTGLGVLSTTLTNKSNKELADKALEIEQEKTRQAALLAAGGGSAEASKKGLSIGAIIGIIAGVLVIGGVAVYFFTRPKKIGK